jgi:FdrA protein
MMKVAHLRRNEYLDSLVLMNLSNDVSSWAGVRQAVIVMGTDSNRRILDQVGLLTGEALHGTPRDLIIAAELESSLAEAEFMARLEERMKSPARNEPEAAAYYQLEAALDARPEARLVSISLPGEFATAPARAALERGRHVFCFSQHVSLEDEIALKTLAVERGLLMMGPDCGTAILDGCGLGFANQVRRGTIGLVSASGSGLQEVTTLVHRGGGGISQAIGVGGRDMRDPVNGLMAEAGVRRLNQDPRTRVIVILAKSASPTAQRRVLEAARAGGKPTVVDFISGEVGDLRPYGADSEDTFEGCASTAVRLAGLEWALGNEGEDRYVTVRQWLNQLAPSRWAVRGLFAGGSLCGEAAHVLSRQGLRLSTNLEHPVEGRPPGHLLLDLGAEEYTQGRAHPFIDPRLRTLEIEQAFADETVAIVLLDVVLGWGCHTDPAGAVIAALQRSRAAHGQGPVVVASLCGTEEDPQDFDRQRLSLERAGVTVAASNAAAARVVAELATDVKVNNG